MSGGQQPSLSAHHFESIERESRERKGVEGASECEGRSWCCEAALARKRDREITSEHSPSRVQQLRQGDLGDAASNFCSSSSLVITFVDIVVIMASAASALCQALPVAEAGRDFLSARKRFCGTTAPLLSSSETHVGKSFPARQHLLLITAQDVKKGTRIFKFNSKKESSEPSVVPSGTKLFRFGAKKQPAPNDENEASEEPKIGTQLFRTLGSFGPSKESGGAVKGGALVPKKESVGLSFSFPRRQDPKTVFVAGATGQIGARIAQKLLRQGFSVRGGVRDLFIAQQLAEFATQYGVVSREEAKSLNAVEFDYKNVESIAKAIGGAAKVVVTIGPTEDGPKSKVTFEDASNVVEAAKLANITNLVVVYEPGTGGTVDNPLVGLASFFTELFSKPVAVSLSELLNQIVESDLNYTLLKTSPTEGVDDISPVVQNIDLRKEGTPVLSENAKISKGQIASVVAEVFINPAVAENKVIEIFTSSSAAAVPISELLSTIPVDGRREVLAAARAKAEQEEREKVAREKVEAEARAAVEAAREASQLAAQLEAEAKQLAAEEAKAATLAQKAQAQAAAAAASVDGLASRMKELGPEIFTKAGLGSEIFTKAAKAGPSLASFSLPAFPTLSAKSTTQKPAAAPAPKLSPPPPKRKQREPALSTPSASVPASKPQVNSIFGGLFTQETIYVDEA